MNSKLLIGIVTVIVIVLGIFVLGGSNKEPLPGTAQTTPTTQNQQPPQTLSVTVDNSGFSPAQLSIKAGVRVNWINNSGSEISINSDEHPTHKLHPELNLGPIPNGSNGSLVFEKAGTYTYHDHYNPSRTGTVVVE